MIKKTLLFWVKLYQLVISPFYREIIFVKSSCRFLPSCSSYTYQVIDRYGVFKGIIMGVWRLLHCHAFYAGPDKSYVDKINRD